MRFSRSTHLLMCLFLETLTSMIRTGQPILVEMIDLVRSAINNLAQMVNFPTLFLDGDSHSPALLDLFISSDTSICSAMAFSHWEILIMLLSHFPLTFHQIHNGMPRLIAEFMTILVLFGAVFVIIWEMFHGSISLNSVLLLLLVNFVSEFSLELMYISLIGKIKSSFTHLHGFQLLVLRP